MVRPLSPREFELLFACLSNEVSLNVVQILFYFCEVFVNLFDVFGSFKDFETEFVSCVSFLVFLVVVIVVFFVVLDMLLI